MYTTDIILVNIISNHYIESLLKLKEWEVWMVSYFLTGNRLSRTRLTPHVAAPPITPPAIAFPTNAAPATTMGANLASGASCENDNDDDDDGDGDEII